MPENELAIETKKLRKVFDDLVAVDSIDIDIRAGSITALLGGNGAGKTTTMAMLLGLLQPTSGSITMLGHDLLRKRARIAPFLNFSSPYVDLPNRLTVRQNLIVYGNLYGVQNLAERIMQLAEQLQMTNCSIVAMEHYLPGSARTRATLAKSLLNEPRLLLLDEPTASLDPDTADWVRTLLMDYRKATGAAIFMASHNMFEVERMCDDVIMLNKGRIVNRGSPRQLLETYSRDNLEEVFLDIARNRSVS